MLELKETDMIGGDWKHLMIRKCKVCGVEKDIDLFVLDKRCKNGHTNVCKECQNKYIREYKRGNEDYLTKRREHYDKIYREQHNRGITKSRQKNPLKFKCRMLKNSMKQRSRRKGFEFDEDYFTTERLMEFISKSPYCQCCGKKLDLGYKEDWHFNDDSPSMDRVDSSKGYIKGNVALLCWGCNRRKQDSTPETLRIIADFIDKWHQTNKESLVLED